MVEGVKRTHPENPKKLILEAKNLVDSIKEASSVGNELPYVEVAASRTRLRDIYKTLLVKDLELSLDQKIEQELWNNCYKNPINQLQEKQKSKITKAEIRQEALHHLTELLESAYGFYLRLLDEICEVYELELPNRATERQLKMMPNILPKSLGELSLPRQASSRYIAQHCLVHLGDIARYRHKHNMADSYYRKAAFLVPSNGQPYNQLAILSAGSSDMLQTVFFYFRAMHVKCPFPGSKVNLERALEKVLKSAKSKTAQKQISKISVLELIRLFLKFHAACYQNESVDNDDINDLQTRLVGAIEIHLSLGGLSRRQLLQMTFISIVNLHRSHQIENKTYSSVLLNFLLSLLDLLIRPPVDPSRHLPSVLSILQFLDQYLEYVKENNCQVWPHLSIMLNRTLPPSWCSTWQPAGNPLPEDVEFKGWTMWKVPPCVEINNAITSESDQTDARAERILYISRKIALSPNSVLQIDFEKKKGHFSSRIPLEESVKFYPVPPVPVDTSRTSPPVNFVPSVIPSMVSPPRPDELPRPPQFVSSPVTASAVPVPPPVRVHNPTAAAGDQFKGPVLRPHPFNAPTFVPQMAPPPGIPPPGIPPPNDYAMGVPPCPIPKNIMEILRHIPPPNIPQTNQTMAKDGSFSKNVPQFFSGSDEMGKNVTNFQKSPFTRMNFPPPPIHSSASPSVQNTKPPHVQGQMHSQGHLQAQAAIGTQKESFDSQFNVSSEPFVPGHRKRPSTPGGIPFEAAPWNRAPGSGDSNTAPIGTNRPRPPGPSGMNNAERFPNQMAPQPTTFNNSQPGANSLFFPSHAFSSAKPVLDPDSYDRKIQSVSEFWDPTSPRGGPGSGVAQSQHEIWAPITTQSSLDSMGKTFLDNLPETKRDFQ